jgi:DNA-binding PucR family transcriptional regulator
VAAAAADPLGGDPLPEIADRLRTVRASSAWRLSPHQLVGVISMRDPDSTRVVQQLEACGSGNVGLSPVFTELDEAPRSFYLAGVALRSTPHGQQRIRKFNETPIAVLVAAAPDAAVAIMRNVLGKLLEIPDHEQNALIETFEMWLRYGGSATDAATRMYVHPNTVRLRLRKLTEITGRHVDHPADVVELVTAIYAWRLVGHQSAE